MTLRFIICDLRFAIWDFVIEILRPRAFLRKQERGLRMTPHQIKAVWDGAGPSTGFDKLTTGTLPYGTGRTSIYEL